MVKILAISDVHGEENENLYTYLTNNDIDLVDRKSTRLNSSH